jgi:hypothetical protein
LRNLAKTKEKEKEKKLKSVKTIGKEIVSVIHKKHLEVVSSVGAVKEKKLEGGNKHIDFLFSRLLVALRVYNNNSTSRSSSSNNNKITTNNNQKNNKYKSLFVQGPVTLYACVIIVVVVVVTVAGVATVPGTL